MSERHKFEPNTSGLFCKMPCGRHRDHSIHNIAPDQPHGYMKFYAGNGSHGHHCWICLKSESDLIHTPEPEKPAMSDRYQEQATEQEVRKLYLDTYANFFSEEHPLTAWMDACNALAKRALLAEAQVLKLTEERDSLKARLEALEGKQ